MIGCEQLSYGDMQIHSMLVNVTIKRLRKCYEIFLV